MALSLSSIVRLSSGFDMPLLGLGVYRNADPGTACLAALKHGYRHIDSARAYGNEAGVGEAIRQSGVKREEVFVTSKIYIPDHGYDKAISAVKDSLAKFRFDYLDLYLIHCPSPTKQERIDTWRALVDLKNEGKLRSIGVSNYSVKHFAEIRAAGLEDPSVNQVELHPFCQQTTVATWCKENGIVVQAYCPLVRGGFDHPVLQELSKKYNKDPAHVLVRWSLQNGFVPLPKSSQPTRVVSNANVYDFELSQEDMKKLDGLNKGKAGAISWNPVEDD